MIENRICVYTLETTVMIENRICVNIRNHRQDRKSHLCEY